MYDAGIFLKNYLDFVEELPNDVQKSLTKARDNHNKTKNLITEVEKVCEHILTAPNDKKASIKMQQILVKITELKDEKIQLSQSLTSHIENKYKAVSDSHQNVVVVKKERCEKSPSPKIVPLVVQPNVIVTKQINSPVASSIPSSNPPDCPEKVTKRIRKNRIENLDVDSTDDTLVPPIKSSEKIIQSAATKRGSVANTAKKAKKRKATKKQIAQMAQDALDEVIQDDNITDETTYCICQQISYGEMIFCENDTCPIEWFHFSCVDLTAKPKGRWFCPQCRGDKPNVINKSLRKKQQESSI